MKIDELEKLLGDSLQGYNEEINTLLNPVDQLDQDNHVDKEDIENISRHTYYLLSDFKKNIIQYLKENDR